MEIALTVFVVFMATNEWRLSTHLKLISSQQMLLNELLVHIDEFEDSELIYDVQDAIKEIYSELNKIQSKNLLEEKV